MSARSIGENALAPYRVLDLTQGPCNLCGKILADLGADVIKIEPPGGDPTRNTGPFYKDTPDPEKSLFWFAYNANKRGITLDIESEDGRDMFRRMVRRADFVIESFQPGYLDSLGLGYDDLEQVNRRIIMTSITTFGQDGPKARYRGGDLVSWAVGGMLYTMGDKDRPPTWVSFPQGGLHGAAEGAAASLVAHLHREDTGEGQHVDVSMQKCAAGTLQAVPEMWEFMKYIYRRAGPRLVSGSGLGRRQLFPCKDGYVAFMIMGGPVQGIVASTKALVAWMAEEKMAPDWLLQFDWASDFDIADPKKFPQEKIDRIEETMKAFFITRNKADLYRESVRRGIILTPVSTAEDVLNHPQLQERGFWQKVYHPALGESLDYCGGFVQMSDTPIGIKHPAPFIGEHNGDIYLKELRIPKMRLIALKKAGVI